MKKILTALILSLLFVNIYAQHSVAVTDNFWASRVNPAALSFGNADGIAFSGNFNSDDYIEDNYSLYFNLGSFAYIYDHLNVDWHTFAISSEIVPNLYSGSSINWYNNKTKKAQWKESLLYRPFSFLSLAGTVDAPFKNNVQYRLGLGIRPLSFMKANQHRIELFGDMIQSNHEWQKPIVGIQTEIFDGFQLGASYLSETETMEASFAFNFNNFSIGSLFHFDNDQEFQTGENFVHLSDRAFKNFIIKPSNNKMYDLKLQGSIVEQNPEFKIGPITISLNKKTTISSIIKKLEHLQEDERVSGIVIKSGSFRASLANYCELVDAFMEFKSKGKKVIFYFNSISNANYAFAAAVGDEIYLNPLGSVDLLGFSTTMPYAKNLLDTLGIEFVNFRSHPYKTAGNMFTEEEMTDAERESMQYLLDGLHAEMVKMIESGRKDKLTDSVQNIFDNGPYFIAQDAIDIGLVDKLIYEDELAECIEKNMGKQNVIKGNLPPFVQTEWNKPAKTRIALIYAIGNIHMGKGKSGKSIGSVTTAKAIKKAREDKSIKGIILRIDSGGGSALASDIIAREVALCNEGENAKPVIISMAGVAASGGYYISALADKIIAQPSTVTGSIGVIGIIPNFNKLYDKIGLNWSTVKTAKNADFASTSRSMKENEKKMISSSIEHTYWNFVETVAKGRKLTKDEVHEIAQGRVWTGQQAADRGLVDELGGMKKAKEAMKEIADLKQEIELIEFDCSDTSLEIDPFQFMMMKTMKSMPKEVKNLLGLYETLQKFEDETTLMMMPYQIDEQ